MSVFTTAEAAAALFQAAITFGLAGLFFFLHRRYRKPHFFWWSVAFGLYGLGLGAIVSFLLTGTWAFLYGHQVIIGWTALALLYAALVFERELRWRPAFAWWLAFPVVWAYLAIFALDSFALAAGTMVVFLAATTGWTAWVFWRYRRRTGSSAAGFLAASLALWTIHHLDYPILRARGAWNPWGYFVDALLVLLTAAGILLLVLEEFREGLATLTALSGDLGRSASGDDDLGRLLERPLGLRGIRGAAIYRARTPATLVRASGSCRDWPDPPPPRVEALVAGAAADGASRLAGYRADDPTSPFLAAIPLGAVDEQPTVLIIAGDVAAAFTALDSTILAAVGAQIGSALRNAGLDRALERRQGELERLSVRMIQQHEEQRRRIGRELHDETAQVFSALKLGLGSLKEGAPPALGARFDRLVELVDIGNRSIRSVTEDLRPAALDDLGLVPAIRALAADFGQWSGIAVELALPADHPGGLGPSGELAIFRAVQEGLSNVARHAQATRVQVRFERLDARYRLTIGDDGQGLDDDGRRRLDAGPGRSGLFGMRERIEAEGGSVTIGTSDWGGVAIQIEMPQVTR
jgi:signal transduction histidine kinase